MLLTNCALIQIKGCRRDKLVLISDMLYHAAKGEGVCKTELMYKVGLSSAQLERYVPVLVKADLLEISNHSKKAVYRTTDKGRNFLDAFDRLVKFLD
jgi:predicted transcriptional regulator